jgi:hypothetical protein
MPSHPQAGPRKQAVTPNSSQEVKAKHAAASCLYAIKQLRAERKRSGETKRATIVLSRALLGRMLPVEKVHKGVIEAFGRALVQKGWTMAAKDDSFHTADAWILMRVRANGSVFLDDRHLPTDTIRRSPPRIERTRRPAGSRGTDQERAVSLR